MDKTLTWIGPFEGSGAYPTINRHLVAEFEQLGWHVLRNQHNIGLDVTPVAIRHTYPLYPNNVSHAQNIGLAVWEFAGGEGVPRSFVAAFDQFSVIGAPSEWVCEQFRVVSQTPIRRVQWGVDMTEFNPQVAPLFWEDWFPDEIWFHGAERILIWAGGTDRRHGFDVAVNVMSLLPDSWHLVAKQSIDYPPDNHQHERVHILRADLPSLAPLFRAGDMYLHSARGVGFSLPCLEAIACGLPVASTDLPPVHDYASGRVEFAGGTWSYMGMHHVHQDCYPKWLEPDILPLAEAVQRAMLKPKWTDIPAEFGAAWSWTAAAKSIEALIPNGGKS